MEQVLDAHPDVVFSEEKDVLARGLLPAMHHGLSAQDLLAEVLDVPLSCYLRYLPFNPVSVTFLTLESTACWHALGMTGWLRFSDIISNPWREIRYEDLVDDLETEARKICPLLDRPWHPDLLDYQRTLEGEAIASPTYADVRKPIYRSSIGRWRHYQKHLEPQFETLVPFIDAFGYST